MPEYLGETGTISKPQRTILQKLMKTLNYPDPLGMSPMPMGMVINPKNATIIKNAIAANAAADDIFSIAKTYMAAKYPKLMGIPKKVQPFRMNNRYTLGAYDPVSKVVNINTTTPLEQQVNTIGHELGHSLQYYQKPRGSVIPSESLAEQAGRTAMDTFLKFIEEIVSKNLPSLPKNKRYL